MELNRPPSYCPEQHFRHGCGHQIPFLDGDRLPKRGPPLRKILLADAKLKQQARFHIRIGIELQPAAKRL
jgi:hypothetical protein